MLPQPQLPAVDDSFLREVKSSRLGLLNPTKILCYFNSVLQLLLNMQWFVLAVADLPVLSASVSRNKVFIDELKDIIRKIETHKRKSTRTVALPQQKLFNAIKFYKEEKGVQQCAFDFLRSMLAEFHFDAKLRNKLGLKWRFTTRSCVQCLNSDINDDFTSCSSSQSDEVLSVLPLSINNYIDVNMREVRVNNLDSLIEKFLSWELMEEGTRCPSSKTNITGKPHRHRKRLLFTSMPSVLTIALNRSETRMTEGEEFKKTKNTRCVQIMELLDMGKYILDPAIKTDAKYVLTGVIIHTGKEDDSGHYFSFVKIDKEWIRFDDDNVFVVHNALEWINSYHAVGDCTSIVQYKRIE